MKSFTDSQNRVWNFTKSTIYVDNTPIYTMPSHEYICEIEVPSNDWWDFHVYVKSTLNDDLDMVYKNGISYRDNNIHYICIESILYPTKEQRELLSIAVYN